MSVRLTRERSWVRAPLLPCKKPRNLGVFYFHVAFRVASCTDLNHNVTLLIVVTTVYIQA